MVDFSSERRVGRVTPVWRLWVLLPTMPGSTKGPLTVKSPANSVSRARASGESTLCSPLGCCGSVRSAVAEDLRRMNVNMGCPVGVRADRAGAPPAADRVSCVVDPRGGTDCHRVPPTSCGIPSRFADGPLGPAHHRLSTAMVWLRIGCFTPAVECAVREQCLTGGGMRSSGENKWRVL